MVAKKVVKKPVKKVPAKAASTKLKNSGNKVEAPIDQPQSKEHRSKIGDARHIKIEQVSNGYLLEVSNTITYEKHIARDKEEVVKKIKRFLGLK